MGSGLLDRALRHSVPEQGPNRQKAGGIDDNGPPGLRIPAGKSQRHQAQEIM